MKKCFKCGIKKERKNFYKHPQMTDGLMGKCKECAKIDARKNYHDNIDAKKEYDRKRIRYNPRRIFLQRYGSMKSRIIGTATRPYKVEGKKIATKKEFLDWCYSKEVFAQFERLHQKWIQSDFDKHLTPSIDRIDNDRGYTLDNMQWITLLANCEKRDK